jgi:hypothetical protein
LAINISYISLQVRICHDPEYFPSHPYGTGSDGHLLSVKLTVSGFNASLMTPTLVAFLMRVSSHLQAIRKIS